MFSKISNLFESLVDQHYKVPALVFNVFLKVLNLFESQVDQHYKVIVLQFDSLRKFPLVDQHYNVLSHELNVF